MKSVRIAAVALLALVFAVPAAAQDAPERQISDTKRQLIHQLIDLMNQRTTPEQIADAVTREMDTAFEQAYVDEVQQSTVFTPQEKTRLVDDHKAKSARIIELFRHRFLTEIDFRGLQETVTLPLYDKYFSEQELADLVAFYSTPTGQKTLMVLPELLGESIRLTNEKIGPQIMTIGREVVAQTLEEMKAEKKGGTRRDSQ
jgi:hypothetical protein